MKNKLVLIDGNSLINRAYYGVKARLSDKNGNPTNAIYGFMNMLIKIINDEEPKYILVAFDRREPTFRHKMYGEYKNNRHPMPEELALQIPRLKQLLTTIGIKIYEQPGIEADDIIGCMAKQNDVDTIIVTGDKDSYQLVDETTRVYYTIQGLTDVKKITIDNFVEMVGVTPTQFIDVKACMGDSSDNYPGIPGVGEKTAYELIKKYGNLDGIYSNLEDFKGKALYDKLINGKDSAYLCQDLATIRVNEPLEVKIDETQYEFPFPSSSKELFIELGFNSFLKNDKLFAIDKIDIAVTKLDSLNELAKILNINSHVTITFEDKLAIFTDGIREYDVEIQEGLFGDGFLVEDIIGTLKPYLENPEKEIICYSFKAFAHFINDSYDEKFEIKCKYQDVDILRYLVDFSGKEEKVLDVIALYNLNKETPAFSLNLLYKEFVKRAKEQGVYDLYINVEIPLAKVLFDMEQTGFKIDKEALLGLGEEFKRQIDIYAKEINDLAGEKVNPNSSSQLGVIIFDKLKLGKGKKTKTGSYSTNAEVLDELEGLHPIIQVIKKYRGVQKLYSTYINGFKDQINERTGLVHTVFNQTLTTTGRLSSKEPNLQNIPVREEEGRKLRKFFIPHKEGNVLVDADYSQIELRLLAHFSECKELIDAYNSNEDIHSITASQVFNVPLDSVTHDMRSKAKAVNFGIIYGISDFGLSKQIGVSVKKAGEYIDNYYANYPRIKDYMEENVAFCKKNGYVYTLLGRRRYIPEISSPNYNVRQYGERSAMNMPLQGTSADIIKVAMVNVYKKLKEEGLEAKLILQVHDELIIDCPVSEVEVVKKILVSEMENAVKLRVPLKVEVGIGSNWYDAK